MGRVNFAMARETSTDKSLLQVMRLKTLYSITKTDEGKNIKAILSYKDGKGFSEELFTELQAHPLR